MMWIAAAYALAGLVCARLVAGHMAWTLAGADSSYCYECRAYHCEPHARPRWFRAWCIGLLAGLIWPLIGLFFWFPFERWSIGEERRHIQRQQADRIAELEKELGLS